MIKNKQIEELLKYLKENDYVRLDDNRTYKLLQDDEDKLLLSYIEQLQTTANKCKQLESKIKILEEQPCFEVDDKTFCFTFKKWKCSEVIKLSEKIEHLENNRDKAIEYINKTVFNEKGYINFCYELENILKGDSDE